MVVTGELDLLAEDDVARALREAVGQAGATSVVLDLTEVGFIDSSGLRALLQGRDAASARGLSFALAVVDGPVTRLLAAAGVSEWFDYA
jgi:anti-anti-sigma factor